MKNLGNRVMPNNVKNAINTFLGRDTPEKVEKVVLESEETLVEAPEPEPEPEPVELKKGKKMKAKEKIVTPSNDLIEVKTSKVIIENNEGVQKELLKG
jgi:F420-0:gamma-glutamyl ligase